MSVPIRSIFEGYPGHLVEVHVDLGSKRINHAVLDGLRERVDGARENDLEGRLELGRGL